MPDLPQLTSLAPSTTPAVPERSYPKAWMADLHVSAPDPRKPISAGITLTNYNPDLGELSPRPADTQTLTLADLSAAAVKWPRVFMVMSDLLACVDDLGPAYVAELSLAAAQQQLAAATAQVTQLQAAVDLVSGFKDGDPAKAQLSELQAQLTAAQASVATLTQQVTDLTKQSAAADAKLQLP